MKKLLPPILVFTLLFSFASCSKDDNSENNTETENNSNEEEKEIEDEKEKLLLPAVDFYNTYIIINNHGKILFSMVDDCIEKYQKSGTVKGMQVENKGNGSFLLKINIFDYLGEEDRYYGTLKGNLTATVSNSGAKLTNNGSIKNIDPSEVIYDHYGSHTYGGIINVVTTSYNAATSERTHNISYNKFSMSKEQNLTWSFTHSFTFQITPTQDGDNTILSTNNIGTGTHNSYGAFTVKTNSAIKTSSSLGYLTEGGYTFYVEELGGTKKPIIATYSINTNYQTNFTDGIINLSYNGNSKDYSQTTSN